MDYFELHCKNYNFHDIVLYCELRVEPDQQLEFLFLIDIYWALNWQLSSRIKNLVDCGDGIKLEFI